MLRRSIRVAHHRDWDMSVYFDHSWRRMAMHFENETTISTLSVSSDVVLRRSVRVAHHRDWDMSVHFENETTLFS